MHQAGTIYHSYYSTLNYLDNMPTHPPPNKEPHVSLNPVLRFPELHTAPSAHQLPILAAQTPNATVSGHGDTSDPTSAQLIFLHSTLLKRKKEKHDSRGEERQSNSGHDFWPTAQKNLHIPWHPVWEEKACRKHNSQPSVYACVSVCPRSRKGVNTQTVERKTNNTKHPPTRKRFEEERNEQRINTRTEGGPDPSLKLPLVFGM